MAIAKALRLELSATQSVAIALHEMIAVIEDVKLIHVPRAPAHCRFLVLWQEQLLPLFDPLEWCAATANARRGSAQFHAIVSYETAIADRFALGCIALHSFPAAIEVDDADACALPAPRWRSIAHACFLDGDVMIPILDLAAMFGRPMEQMAATPLDDLAILAP
ncbi:MAG: hypothetical protein EXR39_13615 [Betaproteobacteria bacterium]|nr:hypothetical protein [Betaproteobacteria bacterium]